MKWFIKCLRHYADFSGRARRKEFWMFALFSGIALFVWAFVLALLIASGGNMDNIQTIQIVIQLSWMSLMGLPGLAVSVRRLHDLGKSGWMALIALIPIIGAVWLLVLMVTEGQTGENRYGPDPKTSPETFPDRAKLTSVGVVTIIGAAISLLGTLCMVLFPILYSGVDHPAPFVIVVQNIVTACAILVAGILFVGAGERERIRPALWIVLAVCAYSCIAILVGTSTQLKMMSEGAIIPVSNIVSNVIYTLLNLSIAIVAALALFTPHNRSAIRGSAVMTMVAGGLGLVAWIFIFKGYGMERLSEIFTLLYATSTVGWILFAWTLFSRKEMPVAVASPIATAPKEPAKQATPIPTIPKEPAKQTPPTQAMTTDEMTTRKLNELIKPFITSGASLFYNKEAEKQKDEALKKILAEGRSGEKFLLDFLLRDVTISGGHFNLRPYGDSAAGEWNKKKSIVLALSGASDRAVIDKLAEILMLGGKENQFYTVFQPAVAETLGNLKEYNALEKYIASGQNVPAILLSRDILRLYKAGVADKAENVRDANGRTPLYKAVDANDIELVKKLLADGADIDAVCSRGDGLGETALHAAVVNENAELVKLLIEHNANLSAAAWNGTFPLQRAAAMGHYDIVKLLVDNGADREQKTMTGKTALMWAEQNGRSDIVSILTAPQESAKQATIEKAKSTVSASNSPSPLDGLINGISATLSHVEKVRKLSYVVNLSMDRSEEEKQLESELLSGGRPALEAIRLFLNGCANGSEAKNWWYNAKSLVLLIPQFKDIPDYPERILHELINNKSNIWEYETQVRNVAKELVDREANEEKRKAEAATRTVTEKIDREMTPEKKEEMKSKTPIMEFRSFNSDIKVMEDGVILIGACFIPFTDIREVVLLPVLESGPAMGGCLKLVTDDDPDLPVRDDHSFHMPGENSGKGRSLYMHNAFWFNCLYVSDCQKANNDANNIREYIMSRISEIKRQ